jgi:hypothetical protein
MTEQPVSAPVTLYKNPEQPELSGGYSSTFFNDSAFEQLEKPKEKTYNDFLARLYDKVGSFYGWDYVSFLDTEYEIVMKLNEILDRKLEDIENGFLSWEQLFVQLAIARALGGKK